MVKFIVLIWTMPGVKLLVCVEIMNEDVCRLGSMYCFLYHYGFWMILVLNIEIEVFNLNNLWTLLPPKKSRPYIPKWDIQNKKLGGEGVLSTRIFLDSYSYSMWKLQGWIPKKKEFLWVDQGKAMRDLREFSFLSLKFCKTFKGFCENQILSKLYGSVSKFLEFWGLKNEPGKFS